MKRKLTEKIISFAEKKVNNYHPCVRNGFTRAIDFYGGLCDNIGWDIFVDEGTEIAMICVFNNKDSIEGRASFILNIETGEISNFTFESLEKFNVSDAFNFVSADKFYKKNENALLCVKSLVEYFYEINAIEFEKENSVSMAARFDELIGENTEPKIIKPSKNTTYVEKPYYPNREKRVVNADKPKCICQRNYITASWQRAGHYRRTRNGGKVYIKPQIVHRKSLMNR